VLIIELIFFLIFLICDLRVAIFDIRFSPSPEPASQKSQHAFAGRSASARKHIDILFSLSAYEFPVQKYASTWFDRLTNQAQQPPSDDRRRLTADHR
jgi:hypothetical protein